MTVTLPKHIVEKLFDFYVQYWHNTSTYDIGAKNMSGLECKDEIALDEKAELIEQHENEIRKALEW